MFGRARKEITVKTNPCGDLDAVDADQGQIEQVLFNLYVNAWQAMPEGGDLTVETANVNLSGEYVQAARVSARRLCEDYRHRYRNRHRRVHPEQNVRTVFHHQGKEQGTGLGLASAYGIIKNHKGFITVYSELSKGSVFTIYLPASVRAPGAEKLPAKAPMRGTGTILLVDDDQAVLEAGGRLLAKLGYRVETANDDETALDKYINANGSLDLVILDMVMPRMGGEEALERMRRIDPHKKILIASGYSPEAQAKTVADKGFDGFIQKPYTLEELSLKIGAALGR